MSLEALAPDERDPGKPPRRNGTIAPVRDDGQRSVLARAFDVLDAFDSAHPALTLTELATRARLPKATVHRLATSLVKWGALERRGNSYRIGLRMFELGSLVQQLSLREIALPFMEDLYEVTHETVHLAVLEGTHVVYLDKLTGHASVHAPSRLGGRMPSYCTGLGKALLAFSPADVVDQAIAEGLEPRTVFTLTDEHALRCELDEISRTGIAYDRQESTIGLACAASPILLRNRRLVGAISVTGPVERFDAERVGSAVRSVAFALSRAVAQQRLA